LDRQRAHIELSLMDQTRPAQEQEQLEQTYDMLFELRQIAATSLEVVQRLERELAQSKEQENGNEEPHSSTELISINVVQRAAWVRLRSTRVGYARKTKPIRRLKVRSVRSTVNASPEWKLTSFIGWSARQKSGKSIASA